VAVTGRAEGEVIETSEIFSFRQGQLRRSDGYPPHRERYEQRGYDLAELLGQDSRGASQTVAAGAVRPGA
jgi:pilus assembly protein CpaF